MRITGLLFCFVLIAFSSIVAEDDQGVTLMPMPASVQMTAGQFVVDESFSVALQGAKDPRLERARERFLQNLSRRTGMPLRSSADESHAGLVVTCSGAGENVQKLGEDESYRLEITPSGARLNAPNPLGILHGFQTFLQLVQITPQGFAVPAVIIDHHPRFPWRGLLIDVSRHFQPIDVLKRNLDAMEALKFNVLHWHLADDQGFRVESRKFPKFQELASDGLFYAQEQIQELIDYARDRGIRVVPEFDMPGHTTSWFVAYPELASGPGPYQIERHWGIFDPAMDPTRDHTYHFLDDFIGEMAKLFPDDYFHIGGDEVNGKQWDSNPQIQQFMQAHHLKDNHDLQAYFNKRLQEIVQKHGKIMEGWDEVLHPDLPREIVVQSWRGQKSLADAAQKGYRGLLSAGYYLDLMFSATSHYAVDPLSGAAANLSPEEQKRILGGEACQWGEYITPENIDERIWPRAAAVAERLWSPPAVRDVDSMYRRLAVISDHLQWLGLRHQSSYPLMLERMSGTEDIHALKVVGDIVEPVKEYARGQLREYTSATPLNRLVDAVHPESDTAREFNKLVDRWLQNPAGDNQDAIAIRNWLTLWRDNDKQLAPLLERSQLLQEVIPLSKDLSTVATIGMQAMDSLSSGRKAAAGWREQQLAWLKQAQKPQAVLLNMIIPPVQKLVQAVQ